MKTGNKRLIVSATLAAIILLAAAWPVFAQTDRGQPRDLEFVIVNATTGAGQTVDRMTIDYVTVRPNNVVDFQPTDSTFTAMDVPILDVGKYMITVWFQDVPYWWVKRGRDLVAGPVTLHVFDAVASLEGVSVTGLNLVVRRQESLVYLEYMLKVDNKTKPQVTVLGTPATFELALPSAATSIEASYSRGPDPTPIEVGSPGKHCGLEVPLVPGQNLIRIEAVVPWTEGLKLPVGSDLAMTSWSILTSPESLEIKSTDIEENDSEKVSGFRRYTGSPLAATEVVGLSLSSGQPAAGPAQDVFTREAPEQEDDQKTAETAAQGGKKPLPLFFMGVIVIVILVVIRRRRS